MSNPCPRHLERLISLAEGHPEPDLEVHVATCEGCAAGLTQFRRMIEAATRQSFAVPAHVRVEAITIAPSTLRRVVARVRSTSILAGARALPGDLQVAVDANGHDVRLMFSRQGNGWEVFGSLPGPDWHADREGHEIDRVGTERFRFVAPRADATAFCLRTEGVIVEIPHLEELMDGSPRAH